MKKAVASVTACDKNEIVEQTAELKELSSEALEALVSNCTSDSMVDFVKQEFTKRPSHMDTVSQSESMEIEGVRGNKETTGQKDSLKPHRDSIESVECSHKDSIESPECERLSEEEAIKRHSFNNSKLDKALGMFLGAFKANIEDINFERAVIVSKSIVEILIEAFAPTFPKEVRSKSHNLKQNARLCLEVYDSTVGPAEFVRMLPSEMQTDECKSKDSEAIRESMLASQVASVAADTDMFKCSRCKEKKCTYSQLQTRSCDEAMTTFVTCTNCGHRWKF